MVRSDQSSLKKLRSLCEAFDWKTKNDSQQFLRQLNQLIRNWKGRYPVLRNIFRKEDMDWLLKESLMIWYRRNEGPFIEFAVSSGYKDKPDLDKAGKPISSRSTALHLAAKRVSHIKAKWVGDLFKIYDRFDVNYTDEFGYNHFQVACMFGCEDVIKKFVTHGQDPNCFGQNSTDSPLHVTLAWSHMKAAEFLLKHGADPNLTNAKGETPLHIIFERHCDDDLAQSFFDVIDAIGQTVDVNAQDILGKTPLHLAAYCGYPIPMKVLLKRGVNPSLADVEGWTPLRVICDSDKTEYEIIPLMQAFFEAVKKRLMQVDVGDLCGNSPLHVAVDNDQWSIAELLLKKGADPFLPNKENFTVMHLICKKVPKITSYGRWNERDFRTMELFFKMNARKPRNIDAQDDLGNTALHWALLRRYEKKAVLLIRRGADQLLPNEEGLTPLDIIFQIYNFTELTSIVSKLNDFIKPIMRSEAQNKLILSIMDSALGRFSQDHPAENKITFPSTTARDQNHRVFNKIKTEYKLTAASGLLMIVDYFHNIGFEYDRRGVAKIIKFFARYGIFTNSEDVLRGQWYKSREPASKTKRIWFLTLVNLYSVFQMSIEQGATKITYQDCFDVVTNYNFATMADHHREAGSTHLCKVMGFKFFQQWLPDFIMESMPYQMPVECWEMILKHVNVEDLLSICLAVTG